MPDDDSSDTPESFAARQATEAHRASYPVEAAYTPPGPYATTTSTVTDGAGNAIYDLYYPQDYAGFNRGMSLEAIAALLGHRSLDMTLRYAKIASRTVADEYFAVSEKVEALYGQPAQLPADAAGPKMTRLRREHHRLLGNGWCSRPPQLDCAFESICETCSYFHTSIEFRARPRHPARPRHHPRPDQPPGTLRPAHPPRRRHPGFMIRLTTITRIMPMTESSPSGI